MNRTENEMLRNNKKILLRVYKSIAYTAITILIAIIGIQFLLFPLLKNDIFSIVSAMFITIILLIFYCTFTIVDEIRKNRPQQN